MSTWGGERYGAGRPTGSGKFNSPTKVVRLPSHRVTDVLKYLNSPSYSLPFYSAKVSAGFPSPADDYLEGSLDLNEYLIQHPCATFFVRVIGDSMIDVGIFPNDILIVDRSLEPISGKVVIAVLNGELTVKRLIKKQGEVWLYPENAAYTPLRIQSESELSIWGVVTNVIHAL